jgi:hypothetical protein
VLLVCGLSPWRPGFAPESCWTSGEQSDTCADFSQGSSVLPCHYRDILALDTHILSAGRTINPFVAAVQAHNLTPLT